MSQPDRLHLIAEFNIETLASYLANTALVGCETSVAPAGPVMASLAAGPPGEAAFGVGGRRVDAARAVIDHFRRALAFEAFDQDEALEEVRTYAAAIARLAGRTRYVLLPTWVVAPFERGWGLVDYRAGTGVAQLLARMNLTLADALRDQPSVFLLDAGRWLAAAGSRGWSQSCGTRRSRRLRRRSSSRPALTSRRRSTVSPGARGASSSSISTTCCGVVWSARPVRRD